MPELPEVETVKCGLQPVLEGRVLKRVIARRPDLRFPLPDGFGQRLTGRTVTSLSRRAKYLLVHLDNATVLIWHLGMSGRVLIFEGTPPPEEKHDHIILETDAGATIRFNDTRRFGFMLLSEEAHLNEHPQIAKLGPEPLDEEFDGAALAKRLAGRKTPIKAALLDQSVVAGLGNIYVSECLFYAGISPRRSAHTVQGGRAEKLVRSMKQVLRAAIASGGSSLRDHRQTSGELGYFQHQFAVYDKAGQPCPGCDCGGGVIRQIVQSGRSTYFCPRRQR
jgi:formamidopyrimidine-DNA glycosylase